MPNPILSAWFGMKREDCNAPEIDDAKMLADTILAALSEELKREVE